MKNRVSWKTGHLQELGKPKTVGALIKLLKKYPKKTGFGFRNQPMQALNELKHGRKIFVVFQ